ncbi:TonB-dependent receptor [Novosphingobium sp.]|uniref:TonB-dependent receptor n=1 Tax=Novosphingobium sp. TaxID=1874826 RepID=UPI003340F57A
MGFSTTGAALRAAVSWHGLVVMGLSGAALMANPAQAQQAAKTDSAAQQGLGDIVVTATRSSSALSKVAASVTAVQAGDLGAGKIKDVQSLASSIPNLSVGDQFGVNRIFIRGIGLTSIDLGADGGVAFLQDGAQIPRPAAQLAGFYDLAQVEVLRGPQGTLYGRGATAGAINLITKRPTSEADGYMRVTYGNYSAVSVEGAAGGALVKDRVMIRVAGKYDVRDGYGVNEFTGSQIDNRNAYAFRGSLLFKPATDVSILLSAETFHESDNNYAFHYFGPTVAPENKLGALLGGQSIFTIAAAKGVKANLRNLYSGTDPINHRNGTSVIGTLEWTPENWSIKSISSYHYFDRFNRDDLNGSNVDIFGQNNYTETSKSYSQEFVGNYKKDRIDAVIGAMYFHEDLSGEVRVPLTNLGILFGLPADTFNAKSYLQQGTVKIDAIGLYAQGTYAFTDQLKLTLGGRFSHEKRQGSGVFDFLATHVPTDKQKAWDAFTPTATLNYQVDPNTLIYATITRGFKSGVINVGSANAVIDPEYVWSYELGVKTAALNNRLQANLSAFYMSYSNLQVGFVNAASIVSTVNAASARNYGVEAELRARPATGLTLELFGTYLNAKYRKFENGYYRANFDPVSLAGNTLDNAPEFSFRAGANYDLPIDMPGKINLRGEVNWQDRVYFTEFNNADATQAPYALINAGISYTSADKRWSLDIWGRNLTNHFVFSNNIITAPLYNSVRVGTVAPPRTYGVTVGVKL